MITALNAHHMVIFFPQRSWRCPRNMHKPLHLSGTHIHIWQEVRKQIRRLAVRTLRTGDRREKLKIGL